MIVCICYAVSDRHIRRAVAEGYDTLDDLQFELGVGLQCGKCIGTACAVLDEARCSHAAEPHCQTHQVHLHRTMPGMTQETASTLA